MIEGFNSSLSFQDKVQILYTGSRAQFSYLVGRGPSWDGLYWLAPLHLLALQPPSSTFDHRLSTSENFAHAVLFSQRALPTNLRINSTHLSFYKALVIPSRQQHILTFLGWIAALCSLTLTALTTRLLLGYWHDWLPFWTHSHRVGTKFVLFICVLTAKLIAVPQNNIWHSWIPKKIKK